MENAALANHRVAPQRQNRTSVSGGIASFATWMVSDFPLLVIVENLKRFC